MAQKFEIKRATKSSSRLKMAIIGIAGSGKTLTSLKIARGLVGSEGRILLLDSERSSASKYADDVTEFDTVELDNYDPRNYIEIIEEAQRLGYDALVIDSLSHAWTGTGGALEMVNNATKRSNSGNSYTAWRDVTPVHNALIDAIVGAKLHLIATMRAKTEYVMDKGDNGRTTIRKMGLAPVQREGMDFEFDIVADMNQEHDLIVGKTRCAALDGKVINKPDERFSAVIKNWLSDAPNGVPKQVSQPIQEENFNWSPEMEPEPEPVEQQDVPPADDPKEALLQKGRAKYNQLQSRAEYLQLRMPNGNPWPKVNEKYDNLENLAAWCLQLKDDIAEKEKWLEEEAVKSAEKMLEEAQEDTIFDDEIVDDGPVSRPANDTSGKNKKDLPSAVSAVHDKAVANSNAEEEKVFDKDEPLESEKEAAPKPASKVAMRSRKSSAKISLVKALRGADLDTSAAGMPALVERINTWIAANQLGATIKKIEDMEAEEMEFLEQQIVGGAVKTGEF